VLVKQRIGGTGVLKTREGNLGKMLIPCRLIGEPFKKLETPEFNDPKVDPGPSGKAHKRQVEILADGQQFVANGINPDCNKEYVWSPDDLHKTPHEALVGLSRQDGEWIIAEATKILREAADELGWEEVGGGKFDRKPKTNGVNGATRIAFHDERPDPEKVRDALQYYKNDDLPYDDWIAIGMAINDYLGDAGFPLFDEWSSKSGKYDAGTTEKKWQSFHAGGGIGIGTLFELAKRAGWRAESSRPRQQHKDSDERKETADGTEAKSDKTLSSDDFHCYMPMTNSYIFIPTRDIWPASSVNARVPSQIVTDSSGQQIEMKASAWLAKHRPVEQMTWAPGLPVLIKDRMIADGGWIMRPGSDSFNLYRPPIIKPGDATKAERWIKHIKKIYPDDVTHIIHWLAQRVQRPDVKINHVLVLGGEPGIGKDTLLAPVKYAVAPWNWEEISPQELLGKFNAFVRSVVIRINEVRDLGDASRYQFYEHLKTIAAAPPDTLRVNEKFLREACEKSGRQGRAVEDRRG
jgi:hypothetical protein